MLSFTFVVLLCVLSVLKVPAQDYSDLFRMGSNWIFGALFALDLIHLYRKFIIK